MPTPSTQGRGFPSNGLSTTQRRMYKSSVLVFLRSRVKTTLGNYATGGTVFSREDLRTKTLLYLKESPKLIYREMRNCSDAGISFQACDSGNTIAKLISFCNAVLLYVYTRRHFTVGGRGPKFTL